jgi:tRNA pseudouridine38-40 synthase
MEALDNYFISVGEPSFKEPKVPFVSQYALSPEQRVQFQNILCQFEGTKRLHNLTYTKRSFESSMSPKRINSFELVETFHFSGIDFAKVRIHGDNFVFDQTRRMVGTAVAMMRGSSPRITIENLFGKARIITPVAPSFG